MNAATGLWPLRGHWAPVHALLPPFAAVVPAMASGGLFAFAASFDDVVIALLFAGPEQRTLPREMFSGVRDSITPALTAVAAIMIVFSTALFLATQSLQRRARRRAAR